MAELEQIKPACAGFCDFFERVLPIRTRRRSAELIFDQIRNSTSNTLSRIWPMTVPMPSSVT
jgi:hypothetical protein